MLLLTAGQPLDFMIFQVYPGLLLPTVADVCVQHITKLRGQPGCVLCRDTLLFCTHSQLTQFSRRSPIFTTLNSRWQKFWKRARSVSENGLPYPSAKGVTEYCSTEIVKLLTRGCKISLTPWSGLSNNGHRLHSKGTDIISSIKHIYIWTISFY